MEAIFRRSGCPWSLVEDLLSKSSTAWSLLVDFAVQRRAHLLLPILIGLSIGCSGPQHVAKYAWLRKQGPVQKQLILDGTRSSSAVNSERQALVNEHIKEPSPEAFNAGSLSAAVPAVTSYGSPRMASDATPEVGRSILTSHTDAPALSFDSSPVQDTTSYYAPEKHRWNAKAIASLPIAIATVVVGIASQSLFILLAGGVVAFVLGLVSARQCRDREDRGKGFALAAMILGGAAMFFSIMVIIWAA